MSFLLDTNVISEPMKQQPNEGTLAWLAEVNEDTVFLSVVTITELRYGIERLAAGRRRRRLDEWLGKQLTARFAGRILPVDLEVADACGRLVARSESLGRPMEPRDAFTGIRSCMSARSEFGVVVGIEQDSITAPAGFLH